METTGTYVINDDDIDDDDDDTDEDVPADKPSNCPCYPPTRPWTALTASGDSGCGLIRSDSCFFIIRSEIIMRMLNIGNAVYM